MDGMESFPALPSSQWTNGRRKDALFLMQLRGAPFVSTWWKLRGWRHNYWDSPGMPRAIWTSYSTSRWICSPKCEGAWGILKGRWTDTRTLGWDTLPEVDPSIEEVFLVKPKGQWTDTRTLGWEALPAVDPCGGGEGGPTRGLSVGKSHRVSSLPISFPLFFTLSCINLN